MAHDRATRKKVRSHYVEQGMPLTTAAAAEGVAIGTARRWKAADAEAGDDWDTSRAARRMSKSGLEEMANEVLHELAQQFTATLKMLREDTKLTAEARGKILVQLMDGYGKAVAASTRALPNANRLAVAMDVIRFLTGEFAENFPKLRADFVSAVEQLGDKLVREFGAQGA
jgi:hypothetical protein